MLVKCKEIIKCMEDIAPVYLAENWDNVGLLVGDKDSAVSKILLALDATDEVIEEAIYYKADMIITHHPIIFKPIKSITAETLNGKIYKLIKNNISIYSAHTNFDIAFGGTSDILARKLGLCDIQVLEPTAVFDDQTYGVGRIGELKDCVVFGDFVNTLKDILDIASVNVIGDLSKKLKRIALCTGSGSEYLMKAYHKGADLYISADVKYHDAQMAQELGIGWVDATHYASENIAIPVLKQYLEDQFNLRNYEVECFVSKINGQPFVNI